MESPPPPPPPPPPQQQQQVVVLPEKPVLLLRRVNRLSLILLIFQVISFMTHFGLLSGLSCVLTFFAYKSTTTSPNLRVLRIFSCVTGFSAFALVICMCVVSGIAISAISCSCDEVCATKAYNWAQHQSQWVINNSDTLSLENSNYYPSQMFNRSVMSVDKEGGAMRQLFGRFLIETTGIAEKEQQQQQQPSPPVANADIVMKGIPVPAPALPENDVSISSHHPSPVFLTKKHLRLHPSRPEPHHEQEEEEGAATGEEADMTDKVVRNDHDEHLYRHHPPPPPPPPPYPHPTRVWQSAVNVLHSPLVRAVGHHIGHLAGWTSHRSAEETRHVDGIDMTLRAEVTEGDHHRTVSKHVEWSDAQTGLRGYEYTVTHVQKPLVVVIESEAGEEREEALAAKPEEDDEEEDGEMNAPLPVPINLEKEEEAVNNGHRDLEINTNDVASSSTSATILMNVPGREAREDKHESREDFHKGDGGESGRNHKNKNRNHKTKYDDDDSMEEEEQERDDGHSNAKKRGHADQGTQMLVKLAHGFGNVTLAEFSSRADEVCHIGPLAVTGLIVVLLSLAAFHLVLWSSAKKLSKHPWMIAADEQRKQMRRAARQATVSGGLSPGVMAGVHAALPPSAGTAEAVALGPTQYYQQQQQQYTGETLFRFVQGVGFVAIGNGSAAQVPLPQQQQQQQQQQAVVATSEGAVSTATTATATTTAPNAVPVREVISSSHSSISADPTNNNNNNHNNNNNNNASSSLSTQGRNVDSVSIFEDVSDAFSTIFPISFKSERSSASSSSSTASSLRGLIPTPIGRGGRSGGYELVPTVTPAPVETPTTHGVNTAATTITNVEYSNTTTSSSAPPSIASPYHDNPLHHHHQQFVYQYPGMPSSTSSSINGTVSNGRSIGPMFGTAPLMMLSERSRFTDVPAPVVGGAALYANVNTNNSSNTNSNNNNNGGVEY